MKVNNLFSRYFKKPDSDKKTIFIVEDNEVYAKSLKTALLNCFSNSIKIKTFYLGEMCLMELQRNPLIVIMDYFLNSKYNEAGNGLEIIKRIKILKPETNIIILSIEKNLKMNLEVMKHYNCIYVQKDKEAFRKIEHTIREIFRTKTLSAFDPWN